MNIQITMAQRQVAPPSYLWLVRFVLKDVAADTHNVENEFPSFRLHVYGEFGNAHGDVGTNLDKVSNIFDPTGTLVNLQYHPSQVMS